MAKKRVIVLGAGLVGGPMALDLAKDDEYDVSITDIQQDKLNKFTGISNIQTIQADLSQPLKVKELVGEFDFVLNAVPGFIGFQTVKAVIEAGRNIIDIAFFPENLFDLDELAREKGVIALSDIGVAPGMSNVLIGYADAQLDRTTKAVIYVGGLPKIREWPYEYKAVFSPADVLEEYTRPARYIENGKEVIKPALSGSELLNFKGVGTLEAFNSDGLRSLATTISADFMIEKTLRYPGHIDIMKVLRYTGFFNKEEIELDGKKIRPLDFTSALLFPKWKLKEGDEDITIMKIEVEGIQDGQQKTYLWELYDEYDPESGIHSMARTTGYTATMALRMVDKGLYTRKGMSAPEFIGSHPKCVEFLLKGLEERGVSYHQIPV
mgnify:CR=1 FL=1